MVDLVLCHALAHWAAKSFRSLWILPAALASSVNQDSIDRKERWARKTGGKERKHQGMRWLLEE